MRPLLHPAIDDITVEGILHALSDPIRFSIYAQIVASAGSQACSTFASINDTEIPKSTLSQHFKVLREAGLIRGERRGVEMLNTSRGAEIEQRFPGLILSIVSAHGIQQAEKIRRSAPKAKTVRAPKRRK